MDSATPGLIKPWGNGSHRPDGEAQYNFDSATPGLIKPWGNS
jgi:hypothetical protein